MSGYQRVGDWLVQKGVITAGQRDEALKIQSESNRRFGEIVISLGFASERDLTVCLAEQYDIPFIEISKLRPTPEALRSVSPTFALSRLILPVKLTDTEIHCVMNDPLDIQATDQLAKALGKRLILSLAGPIELFEAITQFYGLADKKAKPAKSSPAAPKLSVAETAPKRKVKVVVQDDRSQLLGAISGNGSSHLWDWYEEL